jgi:hypothetical protein
MLAGLAWHIDDHLKQPPHSTSHRMKSLNGEDTHHFTYYWDREWYRLLAVPFAIGAYAG